MKTKLNTFIVRLTMLMACLGTLIGINGCVEEDMPYIVLDHDTIEASTDASKYTIDVKTNLSWTAACDQDWIQLFNPQGQYKGQFDIAIEANETTLERAAMITVTSVDGSVQATVMVKQAPKEAELFITEESVMFSKSAGTRNIRVVSNHKWNVISSEDWCTVSPQESNKSGVFEISVTANTTGAVRKATLSVVCEINVEQPIIRTIEVTQLAQEFFFLVPLKEYFVNNEAKDFSIQYEADGDDITVNQISSVEWMSAKAGSDNTIVVTVEENLTGADRTGKIIITASNNNEQPIVEEVVVTQSGEKFFFTVPTKDIHVGSKGKALDINYETSDANVEIRTSANVDWIKLNATRLMSANDVVRKSFSANVEENLSGAERTGKITVVAISNGQEPVTETIEVIQSGDAFYFAVPVKEYKVDSAEKALEINFETSDASAEIRTSANVDWISFPDVLAENTARESVKAVVAANNSGKERTGKISVVAVVEGQKPVTETIEVIQSGDSFYFKVAGKEFNLNSAEKDLNINYETNSENVEVRTSANVDWITFDAATAPQTKAVVRQSIKAHVLANLSGKERTGKITVVAVVEGQEPVTETIEVIQNGDAFVFELQHDSYEVNSKENKLEIVYETSDDKAEIRKSSNVDWITFTKTPVIMSAGEMTRNSFELQVAENTTGKTRTGKVTVVAMSKGQLPVNETLTVVQSGEEYYFFVPQKERQLNNTEETFEISWKTNIENLKVDAEPSASWVKAGAQDGTKMNFTVELNKGEARTATISLSANVNGKLVVETVEVAQEAATVKEVFFTLVEKEKEVGSVCDYMEIRYETNVEPKEISINVRPSADWLGVISVNKIEKAFTFGTIAENTTGKDREARVDVVATIGDQTFEQVCTIKQLAGPKEEEPYFRVVEKEKEIASVCDILEIAYKTNAADKIDIDVRTSADWLSGMSFADGMIQFTTVQENTTGKDRTARIDIIATLGEKVFEQVCMVRQLAGPKEEAPYFTLLNKEKEIGFDWDSFELGYETNIPASKLVIRAESSANWLGEFTSNPVNKVVKVNTVIGNISGKDRVASLVVFVDYKGETFQETCKIIQKAGELSYFVVPQKEVKLGVEDKTFELAWETNAKGLEVTPTSSATWLKVDALAQVENGFKFNAEPNTTGEVRTAEINLTATINGKPVTETVKVSQDPVPADELFFTIIEKEKELPFNGKWIEISYETNVKDIRINAKTSATWLGPVTNIAHSNKLRLEDIKTNDTGKDRMGRVDIVAYAGDKTFEYTCTVKQLAGPVADEPFFTVPQNEMKLSAEDKFFELTWETNVQDLKVTPTSGATWLKVDAFAQVENGFKFNAEPNTTGEVRTAEINLTATIDGKAVVETVKVSQDPVPADEPFFTIIEKEKELPFNGKWIEISYETNVKDIKINAKTSASWLGPVTNIAHSNKLRLEKISENNTGRDRMGRVDIVAYAGDKTFEYTCTVRQLAGPVADEPFFTVPQNEMKLSAEDKFFELTWETNVQDLKVTPTSSAKWLTLDAAATVQNGFQFNAEPNTTGEVRTAEITLTATIDGKPVTEIVKVSQESIKIAEEYFTLVQDEIKLDEKERTFVIDWRTNIADPGVKVTSSTNWAWLDTNSSLDKQATIQVSENTSTEAREAKLTFTVIVSGKVVSMTYTIYQAGAPAKAEEFFIVPQKEMKLAVEDASFELTWKTNVDNLEVTPTSSAKWLTLDAAATVQNGLKFNAEKNETGTVRTAEINLTATINGKPVVETVKVSQESIKIAEEYFTLVQDEIKLKEYGTTLVIDWRTNIADPDVKVTSSTNWAWLDTNSSLDKQATIQVSENTSTEAREAKLTFTVIVSGKVVSMTYTIYQAGAPAKAEQFFTIPQKEYQVKSESENFEISWKTNVDNLQVEAKPSADWVKMNDAQPDLAQNIMHFTASANHGAARTATIAFTATINGKVATETVNVAQVAGEKLYFTVPQQDRQVKAEGEIFDINWETNYNGANAVSVETNADWLSVPPAPLSIDEYSEPVVKIQATKNDSGQSRSAKVTLTCNFGELGEPAVQTVTVYQPAMLFVDQYFNLPLNNRSVSAAQNKFFIEYLTNVNNLDILTSTNAPWIEIGDLDKTAKQINFTVLENTENRGRKGVISLSATINGKPSVQTYTVFQEAATVVEEYFTLTQKEHHMNANGGIFNVTWKTNVENLEVSPVSSADWIQITTIGNNLENGITLGVSMNNSMDARQATVRLNATINGQVVSETFTVYQEGSDEYFEIPRNEYKMTGDAQTFPIRFKTNRPNVALDLEANEDWIIVSHQRGEERINVSLRKNDTGNERTGKLYITANVLGKPITKTVIIKQTNVFAETYEFEFETLNFRIPTVDSPSEIGYTSNVPVEISVDQDDAVYFTHDKERRVVVAHKNPNYWHSVGTNEYEAIITFPDGSELADIWLVSEDAPL